MSFRDWLPWRRPEKRELTLEMFRGLGLLDAPTASGVTVTESNALTLAAYWSGVNLIANAIAKLPRKVYRKTADGSREEMPDHPVAWLVHVEPNVYTVPLVFWRTLMGHVLTWGNGYAEIERDKANRPIGLWTIQPDRIVPTVEHERLVYRYNGSRLLAPADIFHVPGLGFDGIKGYSVVQMAKQSIGLGLAAERYGATFFGNGAIPGTLLEHPAKLSPEAAERLRASWNAMHQGPDKAHRTAVLEEGMKAHALSIPAKDAQLIETREVQTLDIARWLNINPAMLGYKTAERPGGNYEAGRLDFLDNTLDPWLVAVEQECNRKLISTPQRGTYYVEHSRNAVLRTDAKTRAEVQKMYVDMGAMDAEYVAKMENLPKPEPKPEPPLPPAPPDDEDDAAADRAQRALVLDTAGWFLRRESRKAIAASRRGPQEFQKWAEEFYAREAVVLAERLAPAVSLRFALRGVKGEPHAVALRLADEWVARSKAELLSLRAAGLAEQTEQVMQRWALHRPVEMADAFAAMEEAHA
jgi:HK97 family phage portal protein